MLSPASASNGAYGRADRLLHRLALGWRGVIETSFDLDWALFGRKNRVNDGHRPIFVCSLARAGTSLVTRLIAASPEMGSPSYRDMPFPLAPNLWSRLSGSRRRVASTPRGHGDGMAHDLDTPEAIEEVFWRCFEGRRYRRRDGLAPTPPEPETIARFDRYMRLVLIRAGRSRYLSKNNNNVLRLRHLAEAFPEALFVHPFRRPCAQSASLLKQHERACEMQGRYGFHLEYADWLGHHEFGSHRLPFLLPGSPKLNGECDSRDYWLASWLGVYRHLLEQGKDLPGRQFFLDYDSLCRSPDEVLGRLARFLGTATLGAGEVRRSNDSPEPPGDLPGEIEETHQSLLEESLRS